MQVTVRRAQKATARERKEGRAQVKEQKEVHQYGATHQEVQRGGRGFGPGAVFLQPSASSSRSCIQ